MGRAGWQGPREQADASVAERQDNDRQARAWILANPEKAVRIATNDHNAVVRALEGEWGTLGTVEAMLTPLVPGHHQRVMSALGADSVAMERERLARCDNCGRAQGEHVDGDCPVPPPTRGFHHAVKADPDSGMGPMTDAEHALVAMLGGCYGEWMRIRQEALQTSRPGDVVRNDEYDDAEFAAHVHDLQNAVLARAMRRVYPDRYRP